MPKGGNVEERIVEMRLDNKNFESGAKTTISTLEKLERALKMKGTKSSLDDVQRSIDKFDTNNMTKGLEKVQMSFSALEIMGMRVISNLTDSLYGFTMRMAKSLSIDQITAGWGKYEKMIESTQTIMAATAGDVGEGLRWADQEEQMKDIQKYLDGLLWYTDETSYGFTDMTDNLGKFLAAGVDLDQAYKAMMGIASWGATAGAKPGEVARAMYNISQAMGTGSMKAIDWKSIENANMATLDFKKNAIATAAEMGRLDEVISEVADSNEGFMLHAEDMYNDAGYILNMTDDQVEQVLITAENFRDSLQQNWFDKDVMTRVFEKYGQFAELLRQTTSTNYGEQVFDKEGNALEGLTGSALEATDMLQLLDEYRESLANPDYKLDWGEWASGAGTTVENLQGLVQALDDVGIAYSETGFRMGQEAKTFTDALEATKDAVSSQWMKSFQYIFGNYMEAKEFWTDVTTELWDIFASGGVQRNMILKEWSKTMDELGHTGRDYLFGKWEETIGNETVEVKGALWNLLDAIHTVTDPIREALATVFGFDDESTKSTGAMLRELTKRFWEFSKSLGFSEGAQEGIRKVFTAVFTVLKTGLTIVGKAVVIFGKLAMVFGNVFDGIISVANALSDLITGEITFDEFVDQLQNFYKNVKESAKNVIKSLLPSEDQILNFYESIKEKYAQVKAFFQEDFTWDNFKKLLPTFDNLSEKMDRIWNSFQTNYPQIAAKLEKWKKESFIGRIISDLTNGVKSLSEFFSGIKLNTEGASEVFKKFGDVISSIFTFLFGGDPEQLKQQVITLLNTIWQSVMTWANSLTFTDVLKAIRTAGFTVLLAEIGSILAGFRKIEKEIKGVPEAITELLSNAGGMLKDIGKSFKANAFIKMAVAIGILAVALWGLSRIPEDKLTHVAVTLAMIIGVLAILAKKMQGIMTVVGDRGNTTNITILSKFASALLGFGAVIAAIAGLVLVARNVDFGHLIAIFAGVGLLLLELSLLTKSMSKLQFENAGGVIGSILAFSVALDLLIPVMATMAVMSWDAWARAVFGITGLIIALGGAMLVFSKLKVEGGNMLKLAGSFAIMAIALDLLIPVMAVLAAMSGGGFGKAFASMLGILVLFSGTLVALGAITNKLNIDGSKMLAIAGSIAILALAMDLMVPAILAFAAAVVAIAVDIPWEQMSARMDAFKKALGKLLGLAGVMVVFGIAAVLIGAGILGMGVGFLAAGAGAILFALSLTAIVLAIGKLGEMLPQLIENFQKTGKMLTKETIGDILKGALVFGLLGAAIYLVAKALGKLFTNGDVASKISSFAGSLVSGIGGAFKAISGSVGDALPEILKAIGSLLIVVGLYLAGIIPDLANIVARSILTLLETLHQSIRGNKGAFEHSIFGIVETFLEVLFDAGSWAFSVIRSIFDELARNILEWVAEQVEKIPGVGAKFANTLRGWADELPGPEEIMSKWTEQKGTNEEWLRTFIPPAEEFHEVTSESLEGAVSGISGQGAQLTAAIDNLKADASAAASALGNDVSTSLTEGAEEPAVEGGETTGNTFLTSITGTLASSTNQFTAAGSGALNNVLSGANAITSGSGPSTSGGNFVAGVANGTYLRIQDAYDAGFAVGAAEMQGYDDATKTASPSREMVKRGIYAIQGLIMGLEQNRDEVASESSGIGNEMMNALQLAMAQVAILASDSFDVSPVITPVVDMTNVELAAGSIGSKFGGAYVGLSGEISNSVGRRVEQAERVASNMETVNQTVNNGDTFTVNVYASEGMDENALADAVMAKMQARLVRRGAAFG